MKGGWIFMASVVAIALFWATTCFFHMCATKAALNLLFMTLFIGVAVDILIHKDGLKPIFPEPEADP